MPVSRRPKSGEVAARQWGHAPGRPRARQDVYMGNGYALPGYTVAKKRCHPKCSRHTILQALATVATVLA